MKNLLYRKGAQRTGGTERKHRKWVTERKPGAQEVQKGSIEHRRYRKEAYSTGLQKGSIEHRGYRKGA